MSESELHIFLKKVVSDVLKSQGFRIIFEPKQPPCELIKWSNYRPDLVGVLSQQNMTKFIIVECETRPDRRRIARKKWREIAFQTRLFENTSTKFILAIPSGKISKVTSLRRNWEIWQINTATREVLKIPHIT